MYVYTTMTSNFFKIAQQTYTIQLEWSPGAKKIVLVLLIIYTYTGYKRDNINLHVEIVISQMDKIFSW